MVLRSCVRVSGVLSAVDSLVYDSGDDSGDTLLESNLEFGNLLRTVPTLTTLQLLGRSMPSIEKTTLPSTLHHLSMDYIILCGKVAEFIAVQQRAGKLDLPLLTSISLLKCHDFPDLLEAVPTIRSTLPLVSKIKLEIDWEQRGLALLLARILPSVREVHLVMHTKTPLVQDWNEYTLVDLLSSWNFSPDVR